MIKFGSVIVVGVTCRLEALIAGSRAFKRQEGVSQGHVSFRYISFSWIEYELCLAHRDATVQGAVLGSIVDLLIVLYFSSICIGTIAQLDSTMHIPTSQMAGTHQQCTCHR